MPRGVRASGPEGGNAPSSVQKACLILRAMSDARNVRLTDIAQAAAFFAGQESDAITGQTLSVNGGLSTPG